MAMTIPVVAAKIDIARVTVSDAEELLEIYAPYVRNTAISFEYEVPSVEEFRDRIGRISGRYPYIKAVEDGQAIGYAYADCFKGRKAYDWSVETTIYVRKDSCRSGIGRLLYDRLEQSLADMGVLNMNACIASPVGKSPYLTDDSLRFHHAMGFTEVGCFHNSGYKFDQWFDMVWMEKMIGEHNQTVREVRFGDWKIE